MRRAARKILVVTKLRVLYSLVIAAAIQVVSIVLPQWCHRPNLLCVFSSLDNPTASCIYTAERIYVESSVFSRRIYYRQTVVSRIFSKRMECMDGLFCTNHVPDIETLHEVQHAVATISIVGIGSPVRRTLIVEETGWPFYSFIAASEYREERLNVIAGLYLKDNDISNVELPFIAPRILPYKLVANCALISITCLLVMSTYCSIRVFRAGKLSRCRVCWYPLVSTKELCPECGVQQP